MIKYFFTYLQIIILATATLIWSPIWSLLPTGQAFAQKQGLNDSTVNESRSYSFYVNKQINYNEASLTVDIAKGSKIVFEYIYDSGGDARVDANYREKIVFEIDSGDGMFQITDSTIVQHNVYYGQLCMCVDRGYQQVKKAETTTLNRMLSYIGAGVILLGCLFKGIDLFLEANK